MAKKLFWLSVLLVLVASAGIVICRSSGPAFSALASGPDFRPAASTIPRTLFGLNINQAVLKKDPWPTIAFGTVRLWDSGTGWAQLNPAAGKYNWEPLDKWFDLISEHDNKVEDVLYTFGRTPRYASSIPDDSSCGYSAWSGPGQCGAPTDLRPDGTGTDQYFKDFVTAIATHSKNSRKVHIKYWELWNEPYGRQFWAGTIPQLVRMAHDAATILKSIDPNAVIVAPCVGINIPPGDRNMRWYEDYLSAGGADMADILSFHGYIHYGGRQPGTKAFTDYYKRYHDVVVKHGLGSKPVWDTEASWGPNKNNHFDDEDQQAAFIAQFYLLHWSYGVSRLYWYAYNGRELAPLWLADGPGSSSPGSLTRAGHAFVKAQEWLVGATMTEPCTQDGSLVVCNLTRNGHPAQFAWDSDGEKNISAKGFKKLNDLDGNATPISGQVKVGAKPVLLEAQ